MGSKLSLFLLYGPSFPKYGPIFKIAIFGHETWPLAKVPEVAHILPFYPRRCTYTLFLPHGIEIEPIFALRAVVSEVWANFQNCHIWEWNLAIFSKLPYLGMKLGKWPKFQKLHPLSTPGGQIWGYFHSTGSGFPDTGRFSKLPYLGMKLGHWPKFRKLHIYSLYYPKSQISLRFALQLAKILANFPFSHWAQC